MQDSMELSGPPMSLRFPPGLPLDADTSNAGSRLLTLPFEIRLLIYNQLLIQSDGLLRTFCTCKFCANLQDPTIGRECLNPSLLRTNRAIHDEALPILYSKNVFSLFCYGPFAYSSRFNVSRRRNNGLGTVERAGCDRFIERPIANRHSAWAGVARIIKCPSDAAKWHVRRLFFKLDWVHHKVVNNFPNRWWHGVESDVLRSFPGLEKFKVQIPVAVSGLAIYLVFQRKDLMATRKPNYKRSLEDAASLLHARAEARENLRYVEALCDAVVAFQTKGEMEKCDFGVRMVSWTDINLPPAGSTAMTGFGTDIQLGCR